MAYNYEFPYTDPNLYNDDWLLNRMKELAAALKDLDDWRAEWEDEYQSLLELIRQIEAGIFPEPIQQAFRTWMEQNAISLVGELVKMVFFGITDNGYFVAYIPEGWDDIIFNTSGYDIATPDLDFGHLMLSFSVGGN